MEKRNGSHTREMDAQMLDKENLVTRCVRTAVKHLSADLRLTVNANEPHKLIPQRTRGNAIMYERLSTSYSLIKQSERVFNKWST